MGWRARHVLTLNGFVFTMFTRRVHMSAPRLWYSRPLTSWDFQKVPNSQGGVCFWEWRNCMEVDFPLDGKIIYSKTPWTPSILCALLVASTSWRVPFEVSSILFTCNMETIPYQKGMPPQHIANFNHFDISAQSENMWFALCHFHKTVKNQWQTVST